MNIGLLYTDGDEFSLKCSELLVGPALLEKLNFYRFTNKDIQSKSLHVKAQIFDNGNWIKIDDVKLDAVIDYTVPKSPRKRVEKSLLSLLPNIQRVDLNRFELLELLLNDTMFNGVFPNTRDLNSFNDFIEAQNAWGKVVVKSKNMNEDTTILIISKEGDRWNINQPFNNYTLDENEIRKLITNKYLNKYFVQEYVHSCTKDNRAISFNIVTQQRYDGAWSAPFLRGILSTDGIIASFRAGGELIPSPLLHDEILYFEFPLKSRAGKYMNQKLLTLAIAISQRLSEIFNDNLGAFAIKLVIDDNYNARVLSIDPRATSQGAPGRYLEFYKNIVEFTKYLAINPLNQEYKEKDRSIDNKVVIMPKFGITLRTAINRDVLQENNWIDFSIGQGGRRSIVELSYYKEFINKNCFLSFKIGRALNDRVKGHRLSIIALEEYVGKGIIKWNECEFMRSIRVELLQKQYNEAKRFFGNIVPELIWLEDADLGIRYIDNKEQKNELKKSAIWFENLCNSNKSSNWGVTLFNPKTKFSIDFLEILKEVKQISPHLRYLGINIKELDLKLIAKLVEINLHIVLISDSINQDEFKTLNLKDVSLLTPYTYIAKTQTLKEV